MSGVKQLLAEATPLPWFRQGTLVNGPDRGGVNIGPLLMDVYSERDAALIVYLVNHAADYEAAVEALELLVTQVLIIDPTTRRMVDAALARLREPVPS